MTIRTRFAPSPTGYLHIGGVWAALFAWMYARKHEGQFILRIEDTDTKRTVEGAREHMMESLRWFGIDWDEGPDKGGPHGPYVQTERAELYREWAYWLVENDYAYKCFATEAELAEMRETAGGYDRRYRDLPRNEVQALEAEGRPYTIRFKMPLEGKTAVPDLIRGDVVFDNTELNDWIILKSNGLPTYHLAHVVDDHFMEISHVTRGIEWLNTAPLHVQLFRAFGWELPTLVHLPVILSPSGQGKLSKRDQAFLDSGEQILVRADEFMDAGYLPEAVLNFLANIGWTFGDDREKFTIEEAMRRFELADISPAPTKLPYSKLDWLNGEYIKELPDRLLAQKVKPYLEKEGYEVDLDRLTVVMPAMSVRMKRLTDAIEFLRFVYEEIPLDATVDDLTHKKMPAPAAREAYTRARAFVADVAPFTVETLGEGLIEIGGSVTTNGKAGPLLGRMRYAMTGQKVSPPLFESMVALGRKRCLARLDEVLAIMDGDGQHDGR